MNYKQTLDYLFSQLPMYQRIGQAAYKADLNNTIALCSVLKNPENAFKSVHIAGTNGKGSTSHMLAAVLQSAGYKVGLYTSPHLKDFRERIRINGKMIPRQYVVDFVSQYKDEFEKIQPSFFEMTVGLAFDYFRAKKVDVAIIETGLGGRLDSTNVITPLVSVITNISFDHQHLLGNTLPKIAAEKAGIIKPGIPVVIAQQQVEVNRVFIAKAKKTNSEIYFADGHYQFKRLQQTYRAGKLYLAGDLCLKGKRTPLIEGLKCEQPGTYQALNIVGVAQTIDLLRGLGWKVSTRAFKEGIGTVTQLTGLQGRWQVLGNRPLIIGDTAHNEAGIRLTMAQIKKMHFEQLHLVIGMVNDKDLGSVLVQLPKKAKYYFCKPSVPRGLDAEILQEQAGHYGLKGIAYPTVKQALKAAKKVAGAKDFIYVGGSTFVVGDAI